MKTKLISSKKVDATIFFHKINEELNLNLSKDLMTSLSNILALDHATRLKSTPPVNIHVKICIARLQKYLNHKIITDSSFATSMTLFGIAITTEKMNSNETKLKEQNQEMVINSIIEMYFPLSSAQEKTTIKFVLRELLAGKDGPDIINFLNANPKLFHSAIIAAIREKKQQQDISAFVRIHINRLILKKNLLNKKVNFIKNLSGKFSLATFITLISSTTVALANLVFPAFLVPATAASVRYTPVIGEKIGELLINNMRSIKEQKNSINKLENSIANLSKNNNDILQIQQEKIVNTQVDSQKLEPNKTIKNIISQGKNKTKKSFLSRF